MNFGLKNAPAEFQKMMNTVTKTLQNDRLVVFIDDVVIPSFTISEGLDKLVRLLD